MDEQCQKRPHRVEEELGLKPQESDPRTLTNMSGCLLPVRRSLEEEVGEVLGRTSGKSSRVRLSHHIRSISSGHLGCSVERAVKPHPGSQDSPL